MIFATLKYSVLEHQDPFKWAICLIPAYLAVTSAILALFIAIKAPSDPFSTFGVDNSVGIILGVFAGCLPVAVIFFLPYFYRCLVKGDTCIRAYNLPLRALLLKDNCPLYFPAKGDTIVINYYKD